MHRLLVDGVTVEYRTAAGDIRGAQARVMDFDRVDANDWLAVNQFSVMETKHSRRPDVVLFVNGLPLAVLVAGAGTSDSRMTRCCFDMSSTLVRASVPTPDA